MNLISSLIAILVGKVEFCANLSANLHKNSNFSPKIIRDLVAAAGELSFSLKPKTTQCNFNATSMQLQWTKWIKCKFARRLLRRDRETFGHFGELSKGSDSIGLD